MPREKVALNCIDTGHNRFAFETLEAADRFLCSLGWLEGAPSVSAYFADHKPTEARKATRQAR